MEVEYEAKIEEDVMELLDGIIDKVNRMLILDAKLEREVLRDLKRLRDWLNEPIRGTVEVDEEDVRGEPYPDWQDMD